MCDERTVCDNELYLTRRRLGLLGSAAALLALLPKAANALSVVESDVLIETPDGTTDAYFVRPASGKYPGVLVWPDILSLRPAFRAMGKRLAESGYSVLVVNPYYRMAKAPVVGEGATFQDPAVRATVMPFYQALTPATTKTDALAFTAWLDGQAGVDTARKLGTTGYCMGGPMTMRTAAAKPDRVGAGASFHGAGLVTDGADSPHLLVPEMKASYLFAIAENDDAAQPEAKTVLREAYDKAGLPAEIEVYPGTMHGWCALDAPVYDKQQAERAWERLLALFEKALV